MANNERVSQLIELYATDLQSNDIFLVTDMSVRESKKLELGQLMLFIENSGSFLAYNSLHADTASYILGSYVDGPVNLSLVSSQSISSSWADNCLSSSKAQSSSYADFAKTVGAITTIADSASFLIYSATNGTASHAMLSETANVAVVANSLYWVPGSQNGTDSWAMSSSFNNSSSYASSSTISNTASYVQSSSYASTASYASNVVNVYQPVKAWGQITWSAANSALPVLGVSYNIASIQWLQTIPLDGGGGPGSAGYWDLYGVTFTTPLANTNYMCHGQMVGTFTQPYGISVPLSPVMMMPYETRSVSAFTMSINTGTGINRTIAFGGHTTAVFEIFGL